jgi:hypothetical protein
MSRPGFALGLFVAIGASVLWIQPSIGCPFVGYTNCEWERSSFYQAGDGTHTRQPRYMGAGSLESLTADQFIGSLDAKQAGKAISVQVGPLHQQIGSPPTDYILVYTNILGGAGGTTTVFPDGMGPFFVPVTLQNPIQDIMIQNVYFPSGIGNGPSTTAYIDEFNEGSGALLDDTFVKVDPNQLTDDANRLGTINTTKQSVQIEARDPPLLFPSNTPSTASFDRWVTGPNGKIGPGNQVLTVNKQNGNYALALYVSCLPGYSPNITAKISQCSPVPITPPKCAVGTAWCEVRSMCIPQSSFDSSCAYRCFSGLGEGELWCDRRKECLPPNVYSRFCTVTTCPTPGCGVGAGGGQ